MTMNLTFAVQQSGNTVVNCFMLFVVLLNHHVLYYVLAGTCFLGTDASMLVFHDLS